MKRSNDGILLFLLFLAVAYYLLGQPQILPPVTPVTKVTMATYCYEKDDTVVPRGVKTGLMKLNQEGILATLFEEDTTNPDGEIPEQYRIAAAAAKEAGLPCLVIQADDTVVRVIKNPGTEQHVLQAAGRL